MSFGPISRSLIRWGFVAATYNYHILMSDNYSTSDQTKGANTLNNVVYENNTVVEDLNWPTEALEIITASGLEASYSDLRNDQAEKIITAIPEEGLELKVGSTFDMQVGATDGKDRSVSLANAIVVYESLDKSELN